MRGSRGGRDDLFRSFRNSFGGFRGSLFGDKDPFDDPFFTRPFGSSIFGSGSGSSLFGDSPGDGFFDNNRSSQQPGRGPVIEEISSDEGEGEEEKSGGKKKQNPKKDSKEPYVEELDDDHGSEERRVGHTQQRNDYNKTQMHRRSYSFQSCKVTYGGADGAYYTSSTTRKMGDNGVMIEEKKEADTTTGKAEHRISKGIHDKGHTLTRKLNPDGKVDTMQTLHNLNEDELAGFEETWKGNARKHLPGWTERNDVHQNTGASGGTQASKQGTRWALPSTEQRPSVPPNRKSTRRIEITDG